MGARQVGDRALWIQCPMHAGRLVTPSLSDPENPFVTSNVFHRVIRSSQRPLKDSDSNILAAETIHFGVLGASADEPTADEEEDEEADEVSTVPGFCRFEGSDSRFPAAFRFCPLPVELTLVVSGAPVTAV